MRNKISRTFSRTNSDFADIVPSRSADKHLCLPLSFFPSFSSLSSFVIGLRDCIDDCSARALNASRPRFDTWKTMIRLIRESLPAVRPPVHPFVPSRVCPRKWRTRSCGPRLKIEQSRRALSRVRREDRRVVGREQWITFAPRFKVRAGARLEIGFRRDGILFSLLLNETASRAGGPVVIRELRGAHQVSGRRRAFARPTDRPCAPVRIRYVECVAVSWPPDKFRLVDS